MKKINNSAIRNPQSALKTGFTTGTCAQAAAKGAAIMLTTQRLIKMVEVETPSGIKLDLKLIDQEIGEDFARCGIVKDAGADPDVTDGAKIYAQVRFSNKKGVTITGGEGVGKVSKPGLAVAVGDYAINPVPRQMIIKEVTSYLPRLCPPGRGLPKDRPPPQNFCCGDRGLEVTISVPRGAELAKHTFNPRLGIVGGISIIGTTGIVEPKSTDAYKTSLSLQLDVLKATGYKKATLVLGYVGEKFCKEVLKLSDDSIIKIGDHIGFMLKECVKKEITEILLIGHIGKLAKVAAGLFNTHSKFGDARLETIAAYAASCGAKSKLVNKILKLRLAEEAIEILKKNNLMLTFDKIARRVVERSDEYCEGKLKVTCILLSLKGEILGAKPEDLVMSKIK